MRLPEEKLPACFLERLNRFSVLVSLDGRSEKAHLANSGRLRELLTPGRPVYLVSRDQPTRQTRFDLVLAQMGQVLVSVDARLPSRIAAEALSQGAWAPFQGYTTAQPEVRYGQSRLDFLLTGQSPTCLLEVKSVTLVVGDRALFPDGPTTRGQRHLLELEAACQQGWRASVVFIVQRPDATALSPNDAADPRFGHLLRQVVRRGVEAYAYRCQVSLGEIVPAEEIPVILD